MKFNVNIEFRLHYNKNQQDVILLLTTESLLRICRRKSNRAESSSAVSLLKDVISLRSSEDMAELCFFNELQHLNNVLKNIVHTHTHTHRLFK